MKIKTSKYNEVAPWEVKKLIEAGAEIIKVEDVMGIGMVITTLKGVKITTMDEIKINNVTLPLALAFDESYFSCEIEINVFEIKDGLDE